VRKILGATAAVSVLALGLTTEAFAVNADQSMTVKVSSSKAGTKKKPRSVGTLKVDIKTTPHDPAPAFATKKAIIYFDKNLVFNGSKFPSCTLTQAQAHSAACTKAKVGTGSATAIAGGSIPVNDVKVTLFNGPKGKNLWLLVTEAQFNVNTVMQGTLAGSTGKFGKKLIVDIPENLQNVAGLFITLTRFQTNVARSYKRKPYIGLTGCTGGHLNFAGDFTFTDDDVKHADAPAVKCKKK
jgi:hypothetical protein